ncbi:DDE-type integrase/transposase/recombinase [Mesorhizobium sp. M0715]|uniref:DDE-type integrase/transposase/recombinase n=1 Tax=Mesorhizobium sp. M0715 TaxID=2956990 RepID=UPI0033366B49
MLTRLQKKQGVAPKRMITDKLHSYGAARRQVNRTSSIGRIRDWNNRAENAHVPLRKRERIMQGFRSPGALQRFVSIFSALRNLFVPRPAQNAPLSLHIFTACRPWRN